MATYMSAILGYYLPEAYGAFSQEVIWRLVLTFAMMTALFPSIAVLGMWMFTPWVTDLELTDRRERIRPFLVLIFFYSLTVKFLVMDLNLGYIIQLLMLSTTVMILLMVLINTKFKISIHAAAIWAVAGSTLGLVLKSPESGLISLVYPLVIFGGITSTSRLYLGYHSPKEVWVGSIYGFGFSLGAILIFL